MKRFLQSLGLSLTVVVAVGAAVILSAPAASQDPEGSTQALAQTEDGAAESESPDESPQPATTLLPIDQLLDQLSPATEGEAVPAGQRVVLSRDPFRPVVPEPDTGGGTDGGTNGGTDGGTNGGTDGGTNGGTNGGTEPDACEGTEAETVCDGVVVTLDGFTDEGLAIVTVDGTSYTVGVNSEFATSFRVLALNQPCATLMYGDEAFSICAGSTVLK